MDTCYALSHHDLPHDGVALPVELEVGSAVFRRPLQVDDVQVRTLRFWPVHAPKPGVTPEHLQGRAQAEDHVGLLGRFPGPVPVEGPLQRAALSKVDDGVEKGGATDVAAPHRRVTILRRLLSHVK